MRANRPAPESTGPFPALAAVAIIAVLVGPMWWDSRVDDIEPQPEPGAVAEAPAAPVADARPEPMLPEVRAFATFVREDRAGETPLHGHTAEGLRRLADAIAARGGSLLWRDRASRLREAADRLETQAQPPDLADIARDAFLMAADWLDGLEPAASALDAGELLSEQEEQVERFFDAAAGTLAASDA